MEQRDKPYRSGFGIGKALVMNNCGYQHHATPHGYGPFRRDHYLIHCVLEGSGFFEVGGTRYHVKTGEAFLIRPGETTFYIADESDTWSYIWVGFFGTEVDDILEMLDGCPILHYTDPINMEKCVRQLIQYRGAETDPFLCQSELYRFFSFFKCLCKAWNIAGFGKNDDIHGFIAGIDKLNLLCIAFV